MLPSLLYINKILRQATGIQPDVATDLDLAALIDVMTDGQAGLHEKILHFFMSDIANNSEDILYRQAIIRDALGHAEWFYLLNSTIEQAFLQYDSVRKVSQPGYTHFIPITEQLRTAVLLQGILLDLVTAVSSLFSVAGHYFASSGLNDLIMAYDEFYSSEFLITFRKKYNEFKAITQESCMIIGARPGNGLKIADCQIRHIVNKWKQAKLPRGSHMIKLNSISMQAKAMEMRDTLLKNILNLVNTINHQTACEMQQLGDETGFYAGCLNLDRVLRRIGLPVCFPQPMPCGSLTLNFHGLIDVGLALRIGGKPVSNDLDLDDDQLIIITGANQGGKSTFLRSIGLAQTLMQAGLFVTAESFSARVCSGIMTHFCRAEEQSLESGKLDEELRRIDRIIDDIQPHALFLMNESFSSTTSHDGEVIASEIISALLQMDTRILFVTHLYNFAKNMEKSAQPHITFLRAERSDDGVRSYRIREGTALSTSFGLDLYNRIIGDVKLAAHFGTLAE